MPKRESEAALPEISVGPHPAREDWRVMRVSYPASFEHLLKIGEAIDVLLGSSKRQSAPNHREQATTGGAR